MSPPFAIAVAPNGARRTQRDHPRLPIGIDELARDAVEAHEAGAAMIHLHVRDPASGAHGLDADLYRAAVQAIEAALGTRMLIQITTEAVGRYSPDEQVALIEALRPAAVSIALREILPENGDERRFQALFARMDGWGCLHQLILYDPVEMARINDLIKRGLIDAERVSLLAVTGRYGCEDARPDDLGPWLAAGIGRYAWMLCAFGPQEAALMARAAASGGRARVGFENNLWLPDGNLAPSNAALVQATAQAAMKEGHAIVGADWLREHWFRPS